MRSNAELAHLLDQIATLLEFQGDRYRPAAYRRAARSLESLGEEVHRVAERKELMTIPGVGMAIAQKIQEYLETGKISTYERLRTEIPSGLLEILEIPGIGPKTARRFWLEFGIETPIALAQAIEAGRLQKMAGFRERKIAVLRQSLEAVQGATRSKGDRRPLLFVWEMATALMEALRQSTLVNDVAIAGSLRRFRETVGDVDILATSTTPSRVFAFLTKLPQVQRVQLQGETKMTFLHQSGLQVDVRVVAPQSFGASLQYFTGSKEHNIHLRSLARERGLKVNEYGVFRQEKCIAGRTEEEVYSAIGLSWIPPEIREDRGEIEVAMTRSFPRFVTPEDVREDWHLHLSGQESPEVLRAWKEEATRRSLSTLGFILPDEVATDIHRCETIRKALLHPSSPVKCLFGVERELHGAASLPSMPDWLDYWIGIPVGRPPKRYRSPSPSLLLLGHLRPRAGVDMLAEWMAWARVTRTALEVTPFPEREGLDSGGIRRCGEERIPIAPTSRAESPNELIHLTIASGFSRRGWTQASNLLRRR